MPLYRCSCPDGDLNDEQRAAIAAAFTDIHCDLTGAPRTFVHAQFLDRPAPAEGPRFVLHAGIRAGRDRTLAEQIVTRCIEAVSRVAGVPAQQISMRTSGTPASWILEGGHVLPEPGEEAEWEAARARSHLAG